MYSLKPGPPLSDFVEIIWMTDGGAGLSGFEYALPTGTVEIVINLDDATIPRIELADPSYRTSVTGPVVCGVHTQPFLIDHSTQHRSLGINCKPGGAAALLAINVDATKNLQLALADVNPLLAEQLVAAVELISASPQQLMTAISSVLTSHLAKERDLMVQHAIQQIDNEPTIEIANLVSESGYSHRRFNQLFRAETGLTAKQYAKVVRFQRIISATEKLQMPDWSWLAADHGYFDQAHLIHDFRQHAAMTPVEYLKNRTHRLNHPRIEV